MRLRFFLMITGIILLTGACSMKSYGENTQAGKYSSYSGKDTELNLTVDYPAGWSHGETRGAFGAYAELGFYEPKIKGKPLRAYITLTVTRISKAEFAPKTLQGLVDDLTRKRLELPEAKVLSKSQEKLLGTETTDIQLSYKTPQELYSTNLTLIPMKERIVVFSRDDKFYVLRYSNTASDFDGANQLFIHYLHSLNLK